MSKAALIHIPVPLCALDGEVIIISVLVLLRVIVILKKNAKAI